MKRYKDPGPVIGLTIAIPLAGGRSNGWIRYNEVCSGIFDRVPSSHVGFLIAQIRYVGTLEDLHVDRDTDVSKSLIAGSITPELESTWCRGK